MTHQLIDGKQIAQKIKADLKQKLSQLKQNTGQTPGLATLLIGENPASQVYIRNKIKSCQEVGITSRHIDLPASTTQEQLLKIISDLNNDKHIHGILVQLPLPASINTQLVINALDPQKDVDGFHPFNMGNLLIGKPSLIPCTPHGIMKMLEAYTIDPAGKKAVIIGRSNIVGKPAGILLLQANATVTFCHSRTPNIEEEISRADIVVAAVGIPEFVKGEWLKENSIVIDVGINRLPDGRLVGDVHFDSALKKASFITPVPGGVGPMTIAMLLWNTLVAFESQLKRENI
jgi:methylenetetrahydrofolate dehydrogenase (NADP+)/methenyltetrahydrofolate cyclohydrolase